MTGISTEERIAEDVALARKCLSCRGRVDEADLKMSEVKFRLAPEAETKKLKAGEDHEEGVEKE